MFNGLFRKKDPWIFKDGRRRMTFEQAREVLNERVGNSNLSVCCHSEKEKEYYISWVMVVNNYDYTRFDRQFFGRCVDYAKNGWFFGIDEHKSKSMPSNDGQSWAFRNIPEFIPTILKGRELEKYNQLRNTPDDARWHDAYLFGLNRWPIELIKTHPMMEVERKALGIDEPDKVIHDPNQRTFTSE